MPNVSYNVCCCDCIKLSGTQGIIYVNGSVDKYLKMTEYEFSEKLDEWLVDLDAYCHFCGSKNVYGENIEIDDYKLYELDKIIDNQRKSNQVEHLLIINLLKNDGVIETQIGGKQGNDNDFMLGSWRIILDAIDKIPLSRFKKNSKQNRDSMSDIYDRFFPKDLEGQFYISVSGKNIDVTGKQEIMIQSMKMCGFEKSEIINAVNEYFLQNII